jgi:gluconolactonase
MSDSVKSRTALLTSSFTLTSSSAISIDPANLPAQAQLMLPEATVVLPHVPPPSVANGTTVFVPPGMTLDGLMEKPFHIHHPDFLEIIGQNPTLTKIADSGGNPMFHEAPVWYPETDEMFFCQNAGAKAAGTGLEVSAVISKIHVPQAAAVAHQRDATGQVQVDVVDFKPAVINPNGITSHARPPLLISAIA